MENCRVLLHYSLRCIPNVDNGEALVTQVYQAILERRPAQVIPRLQEILAKPDPELRFWLGWPKKPRATMPPLRKVGDRPTANWKLRSKNSRKTIS
jgi:hypothetical protein